MSETSGGAEATGGVSNQLASLVPSFDPSKDDLQTYHPHSMATWEDIRTGDAVDSQHNGVRICQTAVASLRTVCQRCQTGSEIDRTAGRSLGKNGIGKTLC